MHLLMTLTDFTHPPKWSLLSCLTAELAIFVPQLPPLQMLPCGCHSHRIALWSPVFGLPWFHPAWEGSRGGLDSCHSLYWLIIIIQVGLGWHPACTLVRDRPLHLSTGQQPLPVRPEVWMNHWFASAHMGYGILATVTVATENFYFSREGLFILIILTAGMDVYSS